MWLFTEVKNLFLKIGTKEKPVNPLKFFAGLVVSTMLLFFVVKGWGFMIESGINIGWLDIISTFVLVLSISIVGAFYCYGLFRYGIYRNK